MVPPANPPPAVIDMEAEIREIGQKFQVLLTIAVLVATVIFAGLVTLPGGYYDDHLGDSSYSGIFYYFYSPQANDSSLSPSTGTPKATCTLSDTVKAGTTDAPPSEAPTPSAKPAKPYYTRETKSSRNVMFAAISHQFYSPQITHTTLSPSSGNPKADMTCELSEIVKASAPSSEAHKPSAEPANPHSTGESKLSRKFLFAVFMRLAALTIIASFSVLVIFAAARGKELRRWQNAYLLCQTITWVSSMSCFVAAYCLILFIVGNNLGLAMDIMIMGGLGLFLTIFAVVKVWFR